MCLQNTENNTICKKSLVLSLHIDKGNKMKVKIYDTHINTKNAYYHFDVVVKNATQDEVENYAKVYLKAIGVEDAQIVQERCQFCHEELANQGAIDAIENSGYYIIPMQGCPKEGN